MVFTTALLPLMPQLSDFYLRGWFKNKEAEGDLKHLRTCRCVCVYAGNDSNSSLLKAGHVKHRFTTYKNSKLGTTEEETTEHILCVTL